MEADTSLQDPNAQTPADVSQVAGTTTASVSTAEDSGNPAANPTSTPPSVTPAADGTGAGTGESVVEEDYETRLQKWKEARQAPPSAPATPPVETPPPAAQTPPEAEKPRLPAIKVRPQSRETFDALDEFKRYQEGGGKLDLKSWAVSTAPAPPPQAQTPAPTQVEPVQVTHEPETPVQPLTSVQIQARLDELAAEAKEASQAWAMDRLGEITAESAKLAAEMARALHREEREQEAATVAQEQQMSAFDAEVNGYTAQLLEDYGQDVQDGNSALSRKAAEILHNMEVAGRPEASLPVGTLIIYQQAAAELGIPRRVAGAPPRPAQTPQTHTLSPVPVTAPSSIIAGGDGRTQTATRSALPKVTSANVEELTRQYLERAGYVPH